MFINLNLKFKSNVIFLATLIGVFLFFYIGFLNYYNVSAQEKCPSILNKDLKINQTNPGVKELQKYLNNNGFILANSGPGSPGKETTFFGNLTQKALINFKTKNNILPPSGLFDLTTRNYLGCRDVDTFLNFTQDLSFGLTSPEVKELQKYLNNNGFILANSGPGSPGKETTFFGNLTKQALVNFQIKNKVDIFGVKDNNESGIFYLNTRDFLNKEINKNTKIINVANPIIASIPKMTIIHSGSGGSSYIIQSHTLIYTAGSNGTITGATSQTVNNNASGTAVTAVPNLGYHFVNWSDSSTQNPRTDTNVTADKSVTANFAIDTGTCFDGIQNQDETGIDTGGVCVSVTYLIDFGSSIYLPPSNWNSITTKNGSVSNIKNSAEVQSNIDVSISTSFSSTGESGVDTTTGVYPRNVIIDNMYISNGSTSPVINFSSLDTSRNYDFTFFSSRSGTGTRNSMFTINGSSVSLNALGNTNNVVSINSVTPDINGVISVTVQPEGAASYAYLNAIEITEH